MSARLLPSMFRPVLRQGATKPHQTISTRYFQTTSANMTVQKIASKETFSDLIKAQKAGESKPVAVIDCSASWCQPCQVIAPHFEKLSNDEKLSKKIEFLTFDVDEVGDLSQELGVRAMPTFFFFKNGEKVEDITGANLQALVKTLNTFAAA